MHKNTTKIFLVKVITLYILTNGVQPAELHEQ